MKKIPVPLKKLTLPVDRSKEYLAKWKELFSSIDSEYIAVYGDTDPEFEEINKNFEFGKKSRLEGACNTDIQLVLVIKKCNDHLGLSTGKIYCCLQDEAYHECWIQELDSNLDTLSGPPFSWRQLYKLLVKRTKIFFKRIPKA